MEIFLKINAKKYDCFKKKNKKWPIIIEGYALFSNCQLVKLLVSSLTLNYHISKLKSSFLFF